MSDSWITPQLVSEVVEASRDSIVTSKELNDIIAVVGSTVFGTFAFSIVAMLVSSITKRSAKGE